MRKLILFTVVCFLFSSCEKDVEVVDSTEHITLREQPGKGYVKMHLTWTANGVPDDGMLADVSIYLSGSNSSDDNTLNKSLEKVVHSTPDFFGGEVLWPSFVPSGECLACERFFVGVAFNGVYPGAEEVDYPLVIAYTLNISRETSEEEILIKGKFVIDEPGLDVTLVEYHYSVDMITTGNEEGYLSYSFRKLPKKISVTRASDIIDTRTLSANLPLTASLIWKTDDDGIPFGQADLDLVVHDIGRNISSPTEADSLSSWGGYELMTFPRNSTIFADGIPEKFGFTFSSKQAPGPVTVRYLLKLYSYQNNSTRRYLYFGTFTSPPMTPGDGTYYFPAEAELNGDVYEISTSDPVFEWTP